MPVPLEALRTYTLILHDLTTARLQASYLITRLSSSPAGYTRPSVPSLQLHGVRCHAIPPIYDEMITTLGLRLRFLSHDRLQRCVSLYLRVRVAGDGKTQPYMVCLIWIFPIVRFPIVAKTVAAVNIRLIAKCVSEIDWRAS